MTFRVFLNEIEINPSWRGDWQERINAVRGGRILTTAQQGSYQMQVLDNGWQIVKYSGARRPVAVGIWTGDYDTDLSSLVSRQQYERSSRAEQARFDAILQLRKYTANEFFRWYAYMYYPKEFSDWYKQGGTLDTRGNSYWESRLKREGKL